MQATDSILRAVDFYYVSCYFDIIFLLIETTVKLAILICEINLKNNNVLEKICLLSLWSSLGKILFLIG